VKVSNLVDEYQIHATKQIVLQTIRQQPIVLYTQAKIACLLFVSINDLLAAVLYLLSISVEVFVMNDNRIL
jgi:hypothetical protein